MIRSVRMWAAELEKFPGDVEAAELAKVPGDGEAAELESVYLLES